MAKPRNRTGQTNKPIVNHTFEEYKKHADARITGDKPTIVKLQYRIANYHVIAEMLENTHKSNGNKRAAEIDFVPPDLPDGLVWPVEKFGSSPEKRKTDGIVSFLDRVWKDLIAAGVAERRIVEQYDSTVLDGIKSYERSRYDQKRKIPPHLRFLTKTEARTIRNHQKVRQRLTPPSP